MENKKTREQGAEMTNEELLDAITRRVNVFIFALAFTDLVLFIAVYFLTLTLLGAPPQ